MTVGFDLKVIVFNISAVVCLYKPQTLIIYSTILWKVTINVTLQHLQYKFSTYDANMCSANAVSIVANVAGGWCDLNNSFWWEELEYCYKG